MTFKILCSYGVLYSFFFGHEHDWERETFELALDKLKNAHKIYSLSTTELNFSHLCLALKTKARERWSDDAESRLRSVIRPIQINENVINRLTQIRTNQEFDFESALLLACAQHIETDVILQVQSLLPQQRIQYEGVELCTSEYLLLRLRLLNLVKSSDVAEEGQAFLTDNYNILCGFSVIESFFFNSKNQAYQDFELFLARAESAFFTSPRIFIIEPDFDFLVFCLHQKSGEDVLDIEAQLRAIINPLEISFNDLSAAFELHALRGFDLETAILIARARRENLKFVIQPENFVFSELTEFGNVKIKTPRQLLNQVSAQLALYNVESGDEQNFVEQEELETQNSLEKEEVIDLCMNKIKVWVENHESRAVCCADSRVLAEVISRDEFRHSFPETIDLILPSGTPLQWLLKLKKNITASIKELDLFKAIVRYCIHSNKRVTLICDDVNELQKLKNKLDEDHPKISSLSKYSLIPNSDSLSDKDFERIDRTNPDLIVLSLPHSTQERWLMKHYGRFRVPVIGVSDAFQLYTKSIYNPCPLLQKCGAEWIFHMLAYPGKLGPHYCSAFPPLVKGSLNGYRNSDYLLQNIQASVAA